MCSNDAGEAASPAPTASRCRAGCPTPGQHESWGACARAANLQVGPADVDSRKTWDSRLQAYRDARRQGIQPKGTKRPQIEMAKRLADA